MQEHEQLRLHEEGQQEQKLGVKLIELQEQKTQGKSCRRCRSCRRRSRKSQEDPWRP